MNGMAYKNRKKFPISPLFPSTESSKEQDWILHPNSGISLQHEDDVCSKLPIAPLKFYINQIYPLKAKDIFIEIRTFIMRDT